MRRARQTGVSLIAMVFVIVAIAGIVTAIVSMSSVQHAGSMMTLREAQARQAARTGLERGVHDAVVNGSCTGNTINPGGALNGFTVTISCTDETHRETGREVTVYFIQAAASAGTYPNPDFVFRQARVTVQTAATP